MLGEAPPPASSDPAAEAVRAPHPDRLAEIRGIVAAGGPQMAFQPILDLRDMRVLAVQASPRFPDGADPDRWFSDARGLGVMLELELAAVAAALSGMKQALPVLPEGIELWVDASPMTVCAPQLRELLAAAPVPVTVSVAERAVVVDHPELLAATIELRRAGVRLALEGVAAGYCGLRHVLRLQPDVVKLDRSLSHQIHRDLARTELTRAVVRLTRHLGASVVAAGVEERAEVEALLALGITAGQGPGLPGAAPPPPPAAGPTPRTGSAAGATQVAGSSGPRDPEELISAVLELVVRLTGLETAYLTVLDADEAWLEHRFVHNAGALRVPEGLTIPWVDSLCKRCRDAGLLWTADVAHDLLPIPLGRDAPVQTFVSIPVAMADGRTAGTLCAMGSAVRDLDGDVVAELVFFARLLVDRYAHEFGGDLTPGAARTSDTIHAASGDVHGTGPAPPG